MKTFRTIFSGFLAFILLTSSVSPSVSLHFCAGEVYNIAFFGKAQPCGMDNSCDRGKSTSHASLEHKGCCEDAMAMRMLDEYAYAVKEKLAVAVSQSFLVPPVSLIENGISFKALTNIHKRSYRPPLINQDITILVQTFLI